MLPSQPIESRVARVSARIGNNGQQSRLERARSRNRNRATQGQVREKIGGHQTFKTDQCVGDDQKDQKKTNILAIQRAYR